MSIAYVTVSGNLLDVFGDAAGENQPVSDWRITFQPSCALNDVADGVFVVPTPIPVQISDGQFSVQLMATDNTALLDGNGVSGAWYYKVRIDLGDQYSATGTFVLPSSPAQANLFTLVNFASGSGSFTLTGAAGYAALAANNTWTGSNIFAGDVSVPDGVSGADPVAIGQLGTAAFQTVDSLQPQDLNELLIAPAGATGETCPRAFATGTSSLSLISGDAYVRAIGLRAGTPIRNISLITGTQAIPAPANLTHGWYALLDSSFTVRAVSADQAGLSTWGTANTRYTLSVAGAGYSTTYTGIYYVAVSASVSTGVMPSFATSPGPANLSVASISPPLWGISQLQSAPPAIGSTLNALTAGNVTNSNIFYAYTS